MCMCGARVVVSGDNQIETSHTVLVRDLNASQKGGVETAESADASGGFRSRVAACCIGTPDVDEQSGDWLASVEVHEL